MESLYLFSSTRSMKHFFVQTKGFLPATRTMGDFFDFILRVEKKRKIPKFLREYYLYEAICATDTQKLGDFARNFTQFLANSSFFFKFYDELCAECVEIKNLEERDIYVFYEDHLKILQQIFNTYRDLLEKDNFFDKYFYRIIRLLLSYYQDLIVLLHKLMVFYQVLKCRFLKKYLQGFLLFFNVKVDVFNKEYYEKIFGISLKFGRYEILLNHQAFSVMDYKGEKLRVSSIQILEFQDKIAEVGGIFSQIDIWLKQGVQPEQIHIVLPDESFIKFLKLFDKARNFNFAMGESLIEFEIYQKILEILEKENFLFESFCAFESFLSENLEGKKTSLRKKIFEVLEEFKYAFPYLKTLDVRGKVLMFLEMLKAQNLDDVGGGRINVMGVLETRGIALEYVIIPEFNASNVPSLSDKDMFLNTKIRESVGLPTRISRENLQKHYYAELLNNAKEVRILCLNNEIQKPSHFLLEDSIFGIQKPKKTSLAYSEYFLSGKALGYKEQQIIAPLNKDSFSATSLECFLTCKRKFYYRYILGLKEEPQERVNMGSKIHEALKEVYMQAKEFNANVLYKEFCERLNVSFSAREYFESELAKKYLKRVFDLEQERLKEGWNPILFESDFSFMLEGFELKGRIDRIDKKGDELFVLDYKYKRTLELDSIKGYAKAVDFQLPIYYLALQQQYPHCNIGAGFYDLYKAEIVGEKDLEAKANVLKEKLEEIKQGAKEVDFSLAQKRDVCKYCDFIYLCNRY